MAEFNNVNNNSCNVSRVFCAEFQGIKFNPVPTAVCGVLQVIVLSVFVYVAVAVKEGMYLKLVTYINRARLDKGSI